MNEKFIHDTLDLRWYLLKKDAIESSRAVQPSELLKEHINFQGQSCVSILFCLLPCPQRTVVVS